MSKPTTSGAIHPGQWRLSEIQLVNWGTFAGYTRIPVGRLGHLFTGDSGSGKSSILDAVATVLTPSRALHFNAAAQDASVRGEDRTLVSYVRGAYSRALDEETGDAVTTYLRTGATWSGILLRFATESGRQDVNLLKLFHMRGGSNDRADLKQLPLILRGEVSLTDFEDHVSRGIDVRRIRADWPEAAASAQPFTDRFRTIFGIENTEALTLLHKTQSAKNLGSLDALFRDFMLDVPATFAQADEAVAQFGALSQAYRIVRDAQEQVDTLEQLDALAGDFGVAGARVRTLDTLAAATDEYVAERILAFDEELHASASGQLAAARSEVDAAETAADLAHTAVRTAEAALSGVGGAGIEAQTERTLSAERAHAETARRRDQLAAALSAAGLELPGDAEAFAALTATARTEADTLRSRAGNTDADHALHDRRFTAQRALDDLEREIAALGTRRTNMPADLVAVRALIAAETDVPEESLPFLGELLSVDPAYADWTGAIERVLRPQATLLLVPERHVGAVNSVVNGRNLGVRLSFEAVPERVVAEGEEPSETSVRARVIVAIGPFSDWVHRRLREQFDVECVESTADFARIPRAVTRSGLMKRGERRFEKDDRRGLTDPSRWLLGGDNSERVRSLRAQLPALSAAVAEAVAELDSAQSARQGAQRRAELLGRLDDVSWTQIDVAASGALLEGHRASLAELSADAPALGDAQDRLDAAIAAEAAAQERLRDARVELAQVERQLGALTAEIARRRDALPETELADAIVTLLDERFGDVTRASIEAQNTAVTRVLERELADQREARSLAQTAFETTAAGFLAAWPASTANLTSRIEDRSGFADLLRSIRSGKLADHEEQFRDLFQSQTQRLVGHILAELRRAFAEVEERVAAVNASLRHSHFERDRFLQIRVAQRRSAEVREFIADLQLIVDGEWAQASAGDLDERYRHVHRIMAKLGAEEHRAWRERVLDTRGHMSFTGIEIDAEGTVLNVHATSAGLSGGQRQKLVIFCLAAALRYQLTRAQDDVPSFGTVLLDEAFDKADSSFTRMAMDVFAQFGFQMILATPKKLIQTLEPYVGVISYVSCTDHRDSHVAHLVLEEIEAS